MSSRYNVLSLCDTQYSKLISVFHVSVLLLMTDFLHNIVKISVDPQGASLYFLQ